MKRTLFFLLTSIILHQVHAQDTPDQEPQMAFLNSLGKPLELFPIGSTIKYKMRGDIRFTPGYITDITPEFVYISGIPIPYQQLRIIKSAQPDINHENTGAITVITFGMGIMAGGIYYITNGDWAELFLGLCATTIGAGSTAIGIAWLADSGGTVTANRSHRFAYWDPQPAPAEQAQPSEQLPTNPEPAPSNTDIPRLATNIAINSALFPYAELRWLHSPHMESYMGFSRGAAGVGFKVGTSFLLRKYQRQAFIPSIHARLGAWAPTAYEDYGPVIGPYAGFAIDRQMKRDLYWGLEAGVWYAATANYLLPVASVKIGARFGKRKL